MPFLITRATVVSARRARAFFAGSQNCYLHVVCGVSGGVAFLQ
jgi:hypothetical protein